MDNHLLSRHKRGLLVAATLCGALALSACGGSDNDNTTQNPPPTGGAPGPTPPPVAGDSFFAYVMSLVGSMTETAEPVVIDALVETKPENTEPEPVN